MFHDIFMFKEQQEERHKELLQWLARIHDFTSMSKHMLERLESAVTTVQHDVELKEFKENMDEMRRFIGESHMNLVTHLPAHLHNGKTNDAAGTSIKLTYLQSSNQQAQELDFSFSSLL
jgi:hypothetical protein